MRNLKFYQDKMDNSTSLAELEASFHKAMNQVDTDIKTMRKKLDALNDQVRTIDRKMRQQSTIKKSIMKKMTSQSSKIISSL